MIRCPRCAALQEVKRGAVSHACESCGEVFWWALCRSCDSLQRVPDGVEAWRCSCGTSNRAWWRTAASDRHAAARAVEARRAEDSRLLPRPSRPAMAAAALAVVLAAGLSVARMAGAGGDAGGAGGVGGVGGHASAACAAFRDYRSRLQAGLPASAEPVVAAAASAPSEVRDAASRLLAASRASDPDSVMAATSDLALACHPNGPVDHGT